MSHAQRFADVATYWRDRATSASTLVDTVDAATKAFAADVLCEFVRGEPLPEWMSVPE